MSEWSSANRHVARAVDEVTRDLSRRPTLAQVATAIGLEKTYLCKLFHAELGVTFSTWNRRTRINESKHLLAATRLSITEVARAVGYKDVTTFERNFRRCEARTPRQYRRAHLRRAARKTPIFAENSTPNAET